MIRIRPATPDDLERIIQLGGQAFNHSAPFRERLRKELKLDLVRLAEFGGGVAGMARTIPFGHFYGGRAVTAAGVAGVAIAAEARGKGIGTALMREVLAEQRAAGVPVSSLYPATVPLYRQCGYGFGSTRTTWRARLVDLPQDGDAGAEVEPFDAGGLDEVNAAYERIAARTNGLVRRDREWWERNVLRAWDDSIRYQYLVREGGEVTGWVVYQLNASKNSWRFTVACRDLFWSTPRAGRALLSLFALHRSTGEKVEWIGPPDEPLQLLTDDHTIELDYAFRTMIRLLDVPGALEARGYPALADAAVTIAVRDPAFAENAGPWRVEVHEGAAKVAPADAAEATADVGTWGSIWTGLLHPRDAVRVGALEATERALDALEAVFAGPAPWISDFF